MEGCELQKKMYTTLKKQKIFNVRRLPYKQFDNEKFLKGNCSPLKHDPLKENTSASNAKNMEYHYQLAIMTSPAYKELHNKFKTLKEHHRQEKEEKLKLLRQKHEQLSNLSRERQRLDSERERLLQKREELKQYIEQLRYKRSVQEERSEEYRLMNMEYLRNMMMAMHYQAGMDIDPDNMTYEELLQLEERMGKVSKGITDQDYQAIPRMRAAKHQQEELCSICYEHIKQGEEINCLPCKHLFHCDCIKEWLLKEKQCPMCKQELALPLMCPQPQ